MKPADTRSDLDRIMSPRECWQEAGIAPATWWRNYRHTLPIIRISPKRIGVRRSDWLKALDQRAELPPPVAA